MTFPPPFGQQPSQPSYSYGGPGYDEPNAAPARDDAMLRTLFDAYRLLAPFPAPPPRVVEALARLNTAENGSAAEKAKLPELHLLDRPWVPASCAAPLRLEIFKWLERVAVWHNREYSWAAERAIPACWPFHPHIGHELAVLAFLRLEAEANPKPAALEEWHRHSRPQFADRMHAQLGPNGCGKDHQQWPGRPRWYVHTSTDNHTRRTAGFEADYTASDPDRGLGDELGPSWVDPVTGAVDEAGYSAQQPGSWPPPPVGDS